MSSNPDRPALVPAGGARSRDANFDPRAAQMEALRFAQRAEALPSQYPLPDTALHSAQSFYLNLGRHVFIADAPFRLESGDRNRYSLGNAASRTLVALSSKFSDIRTEMGDLAPSKEDAIKELRSTLGAVVQFAAKRASKVLSQTSFDRFKDQFMNKIDEQFVEQLLKELPDRFKTNRTEEARALRASADNVEAGREPGQQRPPSPDELSLMLRSFTELLLERLVADDGSTVGSFIIEISGGALTQVVPTGLWKDRRVMDAVSAADESADIGSKRAAVESFITALPRLAAEAASNSKDLTPEQKDRVLLAAEILYTRSNRLRSDRLQTVDAKTVATESAALNERCARAFKTLFRYKILPPLREPLDIPNRNQSERFGAYERRSKTAILEQKAARMQAARAFNATRAPIMTKHLLEFMDRLESDQDMDAIFPGTLGTVLASTGKEGRQKYLAIRDEILARPDDSRYQTQMTPVDLRRDSRPYVVDEVIDDVPTGRRMIPPEAMVAALEAAYKLLEADSARLARVGDQIRSAQFEIRSTDTSDLITLAKRLDVLEADLKVPDAMAHLQTANDAMTSRDNTGRVQPTVGNGRGEPGSLKWRATADMATRISGMHASIAASQELLLNTRKSLLSKLVAETRAQIAADKSGTDYGNLEARLVDLDLVVLQSRSDMRSVREGIAFFITE